jgi:hypothetical protein
MQVSGALVAAPKSVTRTRVSPVLASAASLHRKETIAMAVPAKPAVQSRNAKYSPSMLGNMIDEYA